MSYKLLRYTMPLLLALIVSGMLVSCINDDFVDACPSESESEGRAVYLSINVKSDSGINLTRAGNEPKVPDEMVDGDWPEHLTTDHIAIFFNENETKDGPGSLYGITTLGLPATHEDFPNDNGKEANYIAVFRVTEEDKDKYEADPSPLPKYCLVILNGGRIKKQVEKYKDDKDADYNTIVKEIWESNDEPEKIGFNDAGRFTMTNSVYVKNGKVHAAQEILPLNFRRTPDDAKQYPVTIYVERMVAKFTFETDAITRSDNDDNDGSITITPKKGTASLVFFDKIGERETLYKGLPWKVRVTGWGINAQEKDSYLFKNIDPTKGDYFELWNDTANCRSYWCEDFHYDYDNSNQPWTYPSQYREALDNTELSSYEKKEKNYLKNYTYNNFKANKVGQDLYSPENTYNPDLYNNAEDKTTYLDDRTSLLAGTHLLVCAQVLIGDDDGNFEVPDHLYRDRQGIYYESDKQFLKMFVHSLNNLLESQRTMDFTLYDWTDGGLIEYEYEDREGYTHEFTAKAVNQNGEIYQLYYQHKDGTTYDLAKDEVIDDLFEQGLLEMRPASIEHGDGRFLPWVSEGKLAICAKHDDGTYSPLEIYTRDTICEYEKDAEDEEGNKLTGFYIEYGEEVKEEDFEEKYRNNLYDNCVKSLLYEWFGPVDHFNNGMMYYAAPISHHNDKIVSYADGSEDAEMKESLGDYGVVRNCWYKFTLTGINRIGTPVDDPDQPIVPELIDIKDVINTKVQFNLLPWHEEETVAPLY